jgi:serine phosphatase RsbU (regulator of sigma subunit)
MQVLNGLLCQRNLRFGSFVTVQYMVLDVRQRHLQFICAGHPPILLRHVDGQIEHLGAAPNLPLGVEETFVYHEEELQLVAGDTLLLYSDGTYERQDSHGVQFGLPRLACLLATAPRCPEAVVHAIQAALNAFSDVGGAKDDTTLLCAQVL